MKCVRIHAGYEISFNSFQRTPMLLCISVHPSRAGDLLTPGAITVSPGAPLSTYRDAFDNVCTRIVAPPGRTTISTAFDVYDTGLPDEVNWAAVQHPVEDLPPELLTFLLGSRYCETDRLSDVAWQMFGGIPPGWGRVVAICDYVHKPHQIQLPGRPVDPYGVGGLSGRPRRVPRFRPSCRHVLPLHEHPCALLHGLPGRYRRAAGGRAGGFLRLVRGVSRRAMVHVRCAAQRAADRPHPDGARGAMRPMLRSLRCSGLRSYPGFTVVTDEVK